MKAKSFDELIRSIREAGAILRGEKTPNSGVSAKSPAKNISRRKPKASTKTLASSD